MTRHAPATVVRPLVCAFVLLSFFSAEGWAAEGFLRVDGIPGDVQDDQFKEAIEVTSFALGAATAAAQLDPTRRPGRPTFDDLQVTKPVDRASPLLFKALATGQQIPTVALSFRRPAAGPGTGHVYLVVTLEGAVVTSWKPSDAILSEERSEEDVTFGYQTINVEYIPTTPDGRPQPTVAFGWDLARNQPR